MTLAKTGINEPPLRAGWYSDPESPMGERWWNGSQWTSHTRPADSTGADSFSADSFSANSFSANSFSADSFSADSGTSDLSPMAWSTASGPLGTLPPVEGAGTTHAARGTSAQWPQTPPPAATPPGWYPDPSGAPAQRWWDGSAWSAHAAPQPGRSYGYPGAPYPGTTVVSVTPPKSVGVAFVLTFLFGPLGMLYSTVSGALIMLGISIIGGMFVGIVTLGLAWLIWGPAMWVTSMIWGCAAASNQRTTQVVTAYR